MGGDVAITIDRPDAISRQGTSRRAGRGADSGRIRVLIADDHAIVRKGLCALLATEPGIEVIGEAQDGHEVIAEAQKLRPDAILMDLVMPRMDGLEATRQITAHQPEVGVLVLTSFASDDKVFPAIQAGARGYLLKDSGPEELVHAIQHVYRGESSLHPTIARRLLQELAYPLEPASGTNPLTEREIQVLRLVAQGWSNQEIAERLAISEATVRTYVSNILSKLKLCRRTQAALYALREGLASLHEVDALIVA
jgi:NarL family two-component system response regulator LiaR